MKKRRYNFMIVGGQEHVSIGMEHGANTDNHYRIHTKLTWTQVDAAKIDLIDVQLDIMEAQIDRVLTPSEQQTFEDVFGK